MKNFEDLKFEKHPIAKSGLYADAKQAVMNFENGYGISVLVGSCFYTSKSGRYECAVLFNGKICYDTPITDDVIGHCTIGDITRIMKQIQELPKED